MELTKAQELIASVVIVVIMVGVIISALNTKEQNIIEKRLRYTKAMNEDKIYCPNSFKFVEGDGFVTPARNIPTSFVKTKIVDFQGIYLYDDNNVQYKYYECNIGK